MQICKHYKFTDKDIKIIGNKEVAKIREMSIKANRPDIKKKDTKIRNVLSINVSNSYERNQIH